MPGTSAPVVCLSALPWAGLQTSRHHLARHLAHDRAVLFVDPPTNVLRARPNRRWRVSEAEPGISVLRPPSHLPYGPTALFRAVTPLNQRAYAGAVAAALRALGWTNPVLWNASLVYPAPLVAEVVRPSVHLFHLTDSIWDYPWFRPEYEGYLERIMSHATFGVASSPALVDRLARYGRLVHHLPHGVDPAVFAPAADGSVTAPEPLSRAPRPRYGFVGNIERRIDIELLCRLAAEPGSVTLVGPVDLPRHDLDALRRSGCRLEAPVGYEEVPAWLAGFDVGLLPYRTTDLVMQSRPLKLLEYLAAGLPVVSPDIPAARELAPHVEVTRGADDFVAAAARLAAAALDLDEPARRAARVERAERESWAERAKALNSLIGAAEEKG